MTPYDLQPYLAETPIINFRHPAITAVAADLMQNYSDDTARTKAAFEFVRDKISHSFDINAEAVTCVASDVLEAGHGICYAKSHLLAAILRAMGIPAGICYQLFIGEGAESKMCLHALNAAYLSSANRFIRFDARGNKLGVDAQFSLEKEQLAFPLNEQLGEKDYPEIYAEPLPNIIDALKNSKNCAVLIGCLPEDIV